jgi:hypothetical protein
MSINEDNAVSATLCEMERRGCAQATGPNHDRVSVFDHPCAREQGSAEILRVDGG